MTHPDDEFFAFTTPNVGFRYSQFGKVLLVTIQVRTTGPRIIMAHLVTRTTVKMLECSGVPHYPAEELPEHIRQAIQDFESTHVQRVMDRMATDLMLRRPSERTIQ